MKTHIATGEEFGTITAELVDGSKPLVLVGLGAVQLITESEDDADQLIRAGELAKQLHRQARAHGEPYVSGYTAASADEVARDAEPWAPIGTEPEDIDARDAAEAEVCPRCESPDPAKHPAMQFEGEVQPCPHPWHQPASPLAPPAPYTTGDLAAPAEDDAR